MNLGVGAGRSAPGVDSRWVLNLSCPVGTPLTKRSLKRRFFPACDVDRERALRSNFDASLISPQLCLHV